MRRFAILLAAVGALMLVPAAQAFANATMKVNVVGAGSGTVDSTTGSGGGDAKGENGTLKGIPPIECSYDGTSTSGICEDELSHEEEFEGIGLRETPAPGSVFVKWVINKGGLTSFFCKSVGEASSEKEYRYCTPLAFEGEVSEMEVTAEFAPAPPPLTLIIEEGEGTVVTNPGGVECSGPEGESCTTEEVEEGTVTLTASPAPGYLFKSWKRCDKKEVIAEVQYGVNGRQCTINLNEAKEVSAKFVKSWDLTATKAGGIGKLQSRPGGILCLFNCTTATAAFKDVNVLGGKPVEMVNKPAKHFHFVEYLNGTGSAEGCNGATECTVSLEEDSSIEGLFAEDPKVALSLSKTGGGQALIKSHPSGILCAYTCGSIEAEFYEGESVEIAWKLNKGTTSIEWSSAAGTCEGTSEATEGSCTVPMSAAHELVADLQ